MRVVLTLVVLLLLVPASSAVVPATLPGPERVGVGEFQRTFFSECKTTDGPAAMVYDSTPSGAVWRLELHSYGPVDGFDPDQCPLPVSGSAFEVSFNFDISRTGGVVTYPLSAGSCVTQTWTVPAFPGPGPAHVEVLLRDCGGDAILLWTWDLTVA